jgi:hypothetical protein
LPADPGLDNLDAVTMVAWIYPRSDSYWHVLDKGEVTFVNGLMDEARLYGYALAEEEILDIYNSSAP